MELAMHRGRYPANTGPYTKETTEVRDKRRLENPPPPPELTYKTVLE